MTNKKIWASRFIDIVVLLVASLLVYLPNLGRLGYYRDDWYYAYDGYTGGASVFIDMFSSDRPARGLFFEMYYLLFGAHTLPYNIGALLWRLLAAIGIWWLFSLIWPKKRLVAILAAVFLLVYPGFLLWVSGIEQQPIIASLCLQIFSIVLTLKAIQADQKTVKIFCAAGAIGLGWVYLALVDYAIGIEVFRYLLVFLLVSREQNSTTVLKKVRETLRNVWFYLVIPVGFVLWKTLIFQNERKATDIGLQLGLVISSPKQTIALWLTHLLQGTVNVSFLAWGTPFYNTFKIGLQDTLIGLGLAGMVIALVLLSQHLPDLREEDNGTEMQWQHEAVWTGLLGVAAGVLPVVLANRRVVFESFSHYALPASLPAAIFLTGLIWTLASTRTRMLVVSILVALATLTHYQVSTLAAEEEEVIRQFWWQVAWRAPGIRTGTTLAVKYPGVEFGEESDIVSGPANFIYYPALQNHIPVKYQLSALSMTDDNVREVLTGSETKQLQYRSHRIDINFKNVLVLSQPSKSSCVHAIDARRPELSTVEDDQIMILAPYSKIENVLTDDPHPRPLGFIFGAEPPHEWCYFYEKAELALQQNDMTQVAQLAAEAMSLGLKPDDQVEWLPFIQAFAILGDADQVQAIAKEIKKQPFVLIQACRVMKGLPALGYSISPDMQKTAVVLFCSQR
jgi:hypothetical protein